MFNQQLSLARQALDHEAARVRAAHVKNISLKTLRTALRMTRDQLGERLGVTKQRVEQLEKREQTGEITINQLKAAADALGCELVYTLLPRASLEATVQAKANEIAMRSLSKVRRTMQLEDQAAPISEADVADYVARHVTERDLW